MWRVVAPGGSFTLHYRLALPPRDPRFRSAWQPFLAPTGGLVGGIHSFMYVVDQTLAPAHVTLDLPAGWSVATVPNGQWSLMIRSPISGRSPVPEAMWAAKPWAVRASATACIAERSERWPTASASPVRPAAIARPYVAPTSSAIAIIRSSESGKREEISYR